jgi:hypothetical protein
VRSKRTNQIAWLFDPQFNWQCNLHSRRELRMVGSHVHSELEPKCSEYSPQLIHRFAADILCPKQLGF